MRTSNKMMRNTLCGIALAMSFAGTAAAANSNQAFSIQGVLRDGTGSLQSMAVSVDINLYPDSNSASKPFYFQHFPTVPVDNGFFSVEVAGSNLSFSTPDVWVGIQIGGDTAELPRQHVTAVPFAFSAATAGTAAALQGVPVSSAGPKDGDLLRYDATNSQWAPVPSSSQVTVATFNSDRRNNSTTSAAGAWWSIPDRSVTFTKRYAASLLKITYQDTTGDLGSYFAGCEWQILVDSTSLMKFSDADMDVPSSVNAWKMHNASHVAWAQANAIAAGAHTVTVQNRGGMRASPPAWVAYPNTGTTECLMGWNTTAGFLSVEEIP
jgi:hypothetical protein